MSVQPYPRYMDSSSAVSANAAGVDATVKGYSFALPSGWRSVPVNDDGYAAMAALLREKLKPLGRPDIEAQWQQRLKSQWPALKRMRAKQIYFEGGFDDDASLVRQPMSFAAIPVKSTFPELFQRQMEKRFNTQFESVPASDLSYLRAQVTATGRDEWTELRSVTRLYIFQQPPPTANLGVAILANIATTKETPVAHIDALTEFADAAMGSFRWVV